MLLKTLILIGCFVLIFSTSSSKAEDPAEEDEEPKIPRNQGKEKQILDGILDDDYDKRIRPLGFNKSDETEVYVNMYIRNMDDLDEDNQELSVQLTFRLEWHDSRLSFEESASVPYIIFPDLEKIWIPDVFFSNEKEAHVHQLLTPNQFVRIFPDGRILYSVRISMTLDCPVDLSEYPFDTQNCFIRLASYGYVKDDVDLKWKSEDPVQISAQMNLNDFKLEEFSTTNCDSQTTTGKYSCLKVELKLNRDIGSFLSKVYIPSILIVIFSWSSFWLLPVSITARCSIGILTIISIVFTANLDISFGTPYLCWATTCLIFVLAAFTEFVIVNYMSKYEAPEPLVEIRVQDQDGKGDRGAGLCSFPKKCSHRLDYFARILFPVAFLLYNIAFWLIH